MDALDIIKGLEEGTIRFQTNGHFHKNCLDREDPGLTADLVLKHHLIVTIKGRLESRRSRGMALSPVEIGEPLYDYGPDCFDCGNVLFFVLVDEKTVSAMAFERGKFVNIPCK
jgi:hypothetical protein